ncbi:MAG TPA: SPOR domain-containing protein [Gammaproteobacteria bacterium]|nr:SPOR domain-containing protein [Gammaproteobacteria bacterium]
MDNLVKQRVVGAVVLVALAVIFIPILLEGPDDDAGPRSLDLPQPIEEMREGRIEPMEPVLVVPPEPVTTVVIGEDGTATLAPDDTTAAVPEASTSEAVPEPEAEAPSPAEAAPQADAAPEPEPEAAPQASNTPAPATAGWVVQVGAFGQEANAIALRDRLRKAGHTAFVERVVVDAKAVYRVRVGPYVERSAAEAELTGLARDSGLQVRVMPHP